ncbi:hypothetical protein [Streptomyces sp. MJM8645]|uniref:hypothetical protein n=1 Tax=Streptomycetaceae TaxID=2062 RepID=UPI0007AF4549|nr:hypothetical protein [Streptomyces sp. MJM8645]
MNLLDEITYDTIAQHTGCPAYTITPGIPNATVAAEVSAMRLRRLLADSLDDGGQAVLLHNCAVRYTTGPGPDAQEHTATPTDTDKPLCAECLHWKSEHTHPSDDESTPDYRTSCTSDFRPLTSPDRVICTRCSQYRAEHIDTGVLQHDYEELTVACGKFTTEDRT